MNRIEYSTRKKLIRITTVPISLKILLKGQHKYMQENGFEVLGVSSPGNELFEIRNVEGINVVELLMTRKISPIQDLISLWNFYKLCKKERPEIVHSHTPKAGIIGMLGAKLANVPIRLHTVAGLPLMESIGLKRTVLNFVEKITYKSATYVLPNSKGLYDFILKNNFTTSSKLKIIGNGSSNGIDTRYFSKLSFDADTIIRLKSELNIQSDDFVFIFIGRLVRDKGIKELVSAFSKFNSNKIKLLLVGKQEPDLDPLSNETLDEIKNNKEIISVGFQNDIRPFLAISDALVFPSYREGFPNVVMQAGSMELPSIVSDINGCNEIIVQNLNGLIVPVKSENKLFEAMMYMLSNKQEYLNMKANSRNMIMERYEQQKIWEQLKELYECELNKINIHDL
ncbi:glycosyltransferase family 4 protein [Sphingobacterium kyonggiense]